MSVRQVMVQYVGSTLRMPVLYPNVLERDVNRIIVNPYSNPMSFVPESECQKLRDVIEALLQCAGEIKRDKGCDACPMWAAIYADDHLYCSSCELMPTLRELGIEV